MANGFEKLEKLFSGSRKKERVRRRATHQKKVSAAPRQSYSRTGPTFPSPSYLRPTSMHMTPRQEQRDRYEREKGRSQSVPNAQEEARRCSSIGSSTTVVDNARTSNDPIRLSTKQSGDLHMTPVLSRFRFPEDSLFKNDESGRMSGDTTLRGTSSETSPCSSSTTPSTGQKGLLDWTPKHISLLFDPLDLNISFNDQIKPVGNTAESLLLPSPIFNPPAQPAIENKSDKQHNLSTRPSSRQTEDNPTQKFTLFPRQQSLSPFNKPYMDSPPASDSGRETPIVSLGRSTSLSALSSPRNNLTLRASAEIPPNGSIKDTRDKQSARETRGNRAQDEDSIHSPNSGGGIPRSRLVRKSASITTLSIDTSQIIEDNTLKEPTFDDFYALSDDDIAESRPVTPAPSVSIPPTPPPKDNPIHRVDKQPCQGPPKTSTAQKTTFNYASGEITPPCTPTDPQFLPLTCSPASPRDTLGAIRAAELAVRYNFAVVYVVSLWPGNGGNYLDPTRRSLPRSLLGKDRGQYTICHSRDSKITGRLLAAYGLNEFPSPFEIVTDTHINALNRNTWVEYRNDTASPNDIVCGWIRPYHGDHVPVSSPVGPANNSISNNHVNRGIVFAAYSKKACNSTIPMKMSPERDIILERLNADAKALVEVFMDNS